MDSIAVTQMDYRFLEAHRKELLGLRPAEYFGEFLCGQFNK